MCVREGAMIGARALLHPTFWAAKAPLSASSEDVTSVSSDEAARVQARSGVSRQRLSVLYYRYALGGADPADTQPTSPVPFKMN